MILTDHQPVYLPWLGLFHKIALSDTFVVLDTVQYLRRDWNNRNKIKTPTGSIWLTVPVYTKGKFAQSLIEVKIDNDTPWAKKHLKSLEMNYKKAKYFDRYIPFFRQLYAKKWDYLVDLNNEVLHFLLKELDINVKVLYAHDLNMEGRKSDLMLDMCKKLKADTYIFGELGKDYAEIEKFEANNIKIYFQEYGHPEYPQFYGDFIPNMSIIDLLFNCGPDSYKILMNGNITKEQLKKELNSSEKNSNYYRPS